MANSPKVLFLSLIKVLFLPIRKRCLIELRISKVLLRKSISNPLYVQAAESGWEGGCFFLHLAAINNEERNHDNGTGDKDGSYNRG